MKIEGPLGIWPWPILNTLVEITDEGDSSSSAVEYNVERDSNGRIQRIEKVEVPIDE